MSVHHKLFLLILEITIFLAVFSPISCQIQQDEECQYPDYAVIAKRDESPYEAWKKCIELADSVFPCKPINSNPNAPKMRSDTCAHSFDDDKKTRKNEFPHMALLGFENYDESKMNWDCSGSLISEQWVMTAAHCFYHRYLRVEVSHVRLGEGELEATADLKFVFKIIRKLQHPDYSTRTIYNDIGLVMLDRVVKYSKSMRPACLHVGNKVKDDTAIDTRHNIINTSNITRYIVKKVVLNKFTHEECSQKYPPSRKSPDGIKNSTQLCYGDRYDDRDTCQGDSGGPLQIHTEGIYCTYTIIGISSSGRFCGGMGISSIYTRVSAYLQWIESIVWAPPCKKTNCP